MSSLPPDDVRNLDVLIVDDATSVRQTTKALLQEQGVAPSRINEAENAREALIFCDTGAPDLLLLDLILPDIPGEEVGSVLMEEHPDMLVVPMTALDSEDGRVRQLIALGAFAILEKPIRRESVARLFEELRRESEMQTPGSSQDQALT